MTNQAGQGKTAADGGGAMSFADILSPVPPETFFADYHGRQVLHVPGAGDKFAAVMSWGKLNDLLNMTGVWSSHSFTMALDGTVIAARDYCVPALDRATGAQVLQPDAELVTALVMGGASLVLNDIDTLNPGLAAVARALETTLECRSQANLYCSSRQHPAFATHFDNHDVYALHMAGEKLWRIYEGRLDNPINHPSFHGLPAQFHDKAKGKVAMEILLKPGDLLYIPRGVYHDALAQTGGTIHVAFSAVTVIGLDLVSGLFERAVQESLFRADFPRRHTAGGEAAFDRHLRALAEQLGRIAADGTTAADFRRFQDNYRYRRGGFHLSEKLLASESYRVAPGFSVVRRGSEWALRKADKTTTIPSGLDQAVAWVVARADFTSTDLSAAQPTLSEAETAELIAALEAMGVITRAARR